MEDGVPVKGFVYRRKQFFSSFENLLESSSDKETKISLIGTSPSSGSAKDKRWRLSNADKSFQQKVVTFEQYAKTPERSRQDSTASNISFDASVAGSDKLKDLVDSTASSIEKWSSMPLLDDQISYTTDLNSSFGSSHKSSGITPKKDINGNNNLALSKVQSDAVTNGYNGVDDGDSGGNCLAAGKLDEETKENKPHWTTMFSHRLNQIRHRFESRSRSDYQKPFASAPKRNFCRGSLDNLDSLDSLSTPVVNSNLKNNKELAKSCADLCDSKLSSQKTFRRNVVQTSSSTKYKQTQNWLEKNLVLVVKDSPDSVTKENAKNTAKENSMNIVKMKQNLKLTASGKPNLTDSEKAELASNAYLVKWGPNGSLAPDIIQHENDGILFSNQLFAGQVKEPIRRTEVNGERITDSQDLVKEIKIIDEEVNGHDEVRVDSAVPPVMVPGEGFTADEKVKERATLKDWDPVSLPK